MQTELEANIKDLNFYKNQDEENRNRIAELESLISAKSRDYDGIHLEVNRFCSTTGFMVRATNELIVIKCSRSL